MRIFSCSSKVKTRGACPCAFASDLGYPWAIDNQNEVEIPSSILSPHTIISVVGSLNMLWYMSFWRKRVGWTHRPCIVKLGERIVNSF